MSWWQVLPVILGALCLILVPGFLMALGCGARGLSRLALAAPLTTTVASLAAIVAGRVGADWSVWWLLLPAVGISIIGATIRTFARSKGQSQWVGRKYSLAGARSLVVLAALALSGSIIGWRLVQLFGRPDNVSQTYDGVFHLNALRYILDTGSASSLTLGGMPTYGESPSFYPAAWHALASLVIQTTNVPIPAAANAVNIVIAAVVWPIGCLFLCTRITGNRPIPLLVTGILAGAFSAFPYLLLDFGVLYPNFLSVALLPACVGLAAMVLKLSSDNHGPWLITMIGFLGTLPGLALAHPSTLMALAALFLPLGGVAMIRYWRRLRMRKAHPITFLPSFSALALYTLIVLILWRELRPSAGASQWKPIQTSAQAVGEILASAPMGAPAAWMLMFLTLAGVLHVVLRRGTWWAAGIFLMTAFLFVVVSGTPRGPLRTLITGVWYNDSFRLAALLPVTTVVLASIGASWILTVLAERLQKRGPTIVLQRSHPRLTSSVPAIAVTSASLVLLLLLTQGRAVELPVAESHARSYALTEDSPLLSMDERELIERLPEILPENAMVAGNPWTGTAYAYALSGIEVLTPHLGTTGGPENLQVLMELDRAASDPGVCSLLDAAGVEYVLEFPGDELHEGDHDYPGVEDLSGVAGLEVLDSEGEAVLYEITAC